MKRTLPLLTLLACQALAVDSTVPTAFPAERYATISEKSPFALATPAVAPPPPPQASFAANWYLTAVGRDAQGLDFVTIKAQDGSVHFSLSGRDEDRDTHVSLASVDWSDTFRKSTAIIKKGTETAKLIFSQEEAGPAAQPGTRGVRPGTPPGGPLPPVTVPVPVTVTAGQNTGVVTNQPQQPMQPRIALPRPGASPVTGLPPQPVVGQAPASGNSPAGGGSYENRRRIRTIEPPR